MTSSAVEPRGRQQDEPDRRRRRRRRRSTSVAIWRRQTSPYWMTRDPPLNWVGVTFASSAPWTRVEDVVRDVEPELDERRADDRQQRRDQVERAVRSRRSDAEHDRHDRRGEERQAGRPQRQEPNDSRGLTGVPRSADSASKYLRDCPTERSEYSKKGISASSQPHARAAGERDRRRRDRRAAPDLDVAPLVVAVARLRPDVRA